MERQNKQKVTVLALVIDACFSITACCTPDKVAYLAI